MRYICPKCNRVSLDRNLWCQERYCPAENAIEVLDNGEWIGDVEIIDPLVILRSSVIYRARRNEHKILIKIAHPGMEEKLKRESAALLQMNQHRPYAMLPTLLPAHGQADVKQFPYGKIVYDGKTRYFTIFDHVEGDVLRNYLLKNPQPWYQHAAWITLSLADVIVTMHQAGRVHLCLHPEIVLLRFDKQNIPRVVLLDLGLACLPEEITRSWALGFSHPAYVAPELIRMQGDVGPRTDVYGLGLLLHEMLTGKPAHEFKLKKDEEIYLEIGARPISPTGRIDLKEIPQIAEVAVHNSYTKRQPDVLTFAKALQSCLPIIPREKKGFKINWRTVAIVIGAALIISLLLVFAAFMPGV